MRSLLQMHDFNSFVVYPRYKNLFLAILPRNHNAINLTSVPNAKMNPGSFDDR